MKFAFGHVCAICDDESSSQFGTLSAPFLPVLISAMDHISSTNISHATGHMHGADQRPSMIYSGP